MGATVCFYFDESVNKDIAPGRANEWYRLAENWSIDELVMIDETRASGRDWFEKLVPSQPWKLPVRRYRKIGEAIADGLGRLVYVERAEKKPSRLCERTVGLYKYEHRPDATYVFGGHHGHGLEGLSVGGDWVHVPTGGPCGFAIQIAAMVMSDRERKTTIKDESRTLQTKRDRDLEDVVKQVGQINRSALRVLSKVVQ